MTVRYTRGAGSIQALLPIDEIQGDVLCLRGGEYRAILETGTVNFALKSESEQAAILAGYRALLNGLLFPIQVLIRVVPTDVERYLSALGGRSGRNATLARLALDHEAFVRRLARQRTLLDRQFYLVIPADTEASGVRRSLFSWRGGSGRETHHTLAGASHQLALRSDDLIQRMAGMGLSARRLSGKEIAALWFTMLTSELSRTQPLAHTPWPIAVIGSHDEEVHHDR